MPGRRRGRPTKVRQLVTVPSDENPSRKITVGEYICELMQARGITATLCADIVGVDRGSIRSWLKKGADAEHKNDRGAHLLTRDDKVYLDFLIATRAAHARWIEARLKTHAQISEGGLTLTEVVQEVDPSEQITNEDGSKSPKILKRRTKTQRLLPDPAGLRWELERLARDEDGQRLFAQRVEVTGSDGEPLVPLDDKDQRAAELAAELAAFQQGVEEQRRLEAERTVGSDG